MTSPTRPDSKALGSLVLGLLGVVGAVCFVGLPLGVGAILLGAVALRDMRRPGGTDANRGLATAGIVLGAIASVLFVAWTSVVAVTLLGARRAPHPTWQAMQVVDLRVAGRPLREQLLAEASLAKQKGATVLVETTASRCARCGEIDGAMPDPVMQSALSGVVLVRVDVAPFHPELRALRMDEETVPWFYVLDARGVPRDGISADEWDEDDASDIAPVLEEFVSGRLHARRAEWRGGPAL